MPDKEKRITLLCAFILPMLLGAAAFSSIGIFPFGEKALLIADMDSEYIDYLAQMNEAVRASGSLLRSWNMGMGLNMLGLIAFYTASPLNLLVLLLPLSIITEAVFAVTLLKFGLCGLFFAMFAREVFPAAGREFHVMFAAAYALCAYNIAYSSNIMWLDGAAFLPLVLLGVERILRGGRYGLFLFGLVYVFFTSYYIGYMIGVFSFLYFTASYFARHNSFKRYLDMLWRFAGTAVLAAGCLAFLLLPAFLNLKDGQSDMWNLPFRPELRYTGVRLSAKLLPGTYDSLTDAGLPHIYCTVAAALFLVLFFCIKAVPLREKLVFGGLIGFMLISFSSEFLDLAWHAFEDPTWYPARYSFVFSFLILRLALRCVSLREQITRYEILGALLLLSVLFVEIGINRFYFARMWPVLAGIALATAYALIMIFGKRKSGKSRQGRIYAALLVFFVCIESFGNASVMARGMDWQFGYANRAEYRDFMSRYGAAVDGMKQLDTGVYRAELVGMRTANSAMALGYNGISHYSTTTDQSLNAFLQQLGYIHGTENELRFSRSTPLTNGLLGIRYVISPQDMGSGYILRGTSGDLGVYENTAAFPLAFWSPPLAADYEPDTENGPFVLQNGLARALTGVNSPAFIGLPAAEELNNTERTVWDGHTVYERLVRGKPASVGFAVENPSRDEAYAYFPVYTNLFADADVYVNDVFAQSDFGYRSNTIIPLGGAEADAVRIELDYWGLDITGAYFARLDLNAAQNAAAKASENAMQFTTFLDTRVEGTIFAPEDGVFATTFPYDDGWTLEIDGRRVEPERLAGVFLSASLAKGEHAVSMRYAPAGFRAGMAVSTATWVAVALWYLRRKFNSRGGSRT